MSFVPFANLDQGRDASSTSQSLGTSRPSAAPSAAEDLRSFIFEVSAGRPAGVADATEVPDFDAIAPARRFARRQSRAEQPHAGEAANSARTPARTQPQSAPEAIKFSGASGAKSGGAADSWQLLETVGDPTAGRGAIGRASSVSSPPKPRPLPRRRQQQALPICTASVGVHLLLIAALAIAGIAAADRPEEILLTVGPPPVEELLLAEADFESPEPTEQPETIADELPSDLLDPGMAAFGELETTAALANVSATGEPAVAAGTLGGDLGALFGENGAGLGEFGGGLGGAPTAKFFGSEIEGRRIVFVLDNSGSMQGGRLETVIAELLRCVESLRDDQEFYVIFQSDMVYPMLYPDPVDRYLRPTPANRRLLAEWLDTVELCLGDSVEEALAAAAMIEPDTVFLLSDGRIQGDKKFRYLLDGRLRNFPVHTFAVGMNSSVAGRRNLQQIADANGGKFSESEIPPEMRDLSRTKLRPYHNETPGAVWGRNVKPFKKF